LKFKEICAKETILSLKVSTFM